MSLRDIITLPDPILRQTSKPVTGVDKAVRKTFDDMLETMYNAPGIGLAAIQIGLPQSLLVIDISKNGEARQPLFLANHQTLSDNDALSAS